VDVNAHGGSVAGSVTGDEVLLRVVGPFSVHRAGREQARAEVGSRKARTLLALLAVHRPRLVPVDQVVEALWAQAPPRHPVRNVATLVSRLRAALGPDVVVGDGSGYRLGDAPRVDLYQADAILARAEARLAGHEPARDPDRDPGRALAAAVTALRLLDGAVLLADHPCAAWAEPARIQHRQLLRRARLTTAAAALRCGDFHTARSTAQAAIEADPLDETAHRTLMTACDTAGEPAQALLAYQRLRATLADELGVDPAPATRDLHTAILQRNADATRRVTVPRPRSSRSRSAGDRAC
jgi:DNA-binding SARP family transcriptional activator